MATQRFKRFLDSIPGFKGYQDKESRRESDRLIREQLARDYQEQADRLGRMLTKFADQRALRAVSVVDGPHQRLTHFIARLRTASYGYAGLFSNRPVDQHALDQIAEFDQSLAEDVPALSQAISDLEAIDANDPAFAEQVEEISQAIEQLHDRFDRRGEVIENAEPIPEESMLAILHPEGKARATHPTAYRLHDGDALTYRDENFEIVGRITITGDDANWRDFQLNGGAEPAWLRVPASSTGEFLWLTEAQIESAEDDAVRVGGKSFTLSSEQSAQAEVAVRGGGEAERATSIRTYQSDDDDLVLCVYDWGAEHMALKGRKIDPIELQLWSREGGRAI